MLKNSALYQTGDICLVKFHPAVGVELKRFRPAVVVTNALNKQDGHHVLIIPFSTSTLKLFPDFEFDVSNSALTKTSKLLCWYLRTVDSNRIETKLGTLSGKDRNKMITSVQKVIKG